MKTMDDVMYISGCKILLPMTYDGNTKLILSRRNSIVFAIRGDGIMLERVNATNLQNLVKMLDALVRYAGFLSLKAIRYYESLPDRLIKLLTDYGFIEEEFLFSEINAMSLYLR